MELIKWWKNKNALILIIVSVLIVILSALAVIFIPKPYNWIVLVILVIIGRIVIKIYLPKTVISLTEDDNNV